MSLLTLLRGEVEAGSARSSRARAHTRLPTAFAFLYPFTYVSSLIYLFILSVDQFFFLSFFSLVRFKCIRLLLHSLGFLLFVISFFLFVFFILVNDVRTPINLSLFFNQFDYLFFSDPPSYLSIYVGTSLFI